MTELKLIIGLAAICFSMFTTGYLKGAMDEEAKWIIHRHDESNHRDGTWVEDRRK